MSDSHKLRKLIIKIIKEELGKPKTRSFKGFGTSSPIYTHATKASLGDGDVTEPYSDKSKQTDIGEAPAVVKVSRAFKASDS